MVALGATAIVPMSSAAAATPAAVLQVEPVDGISLADTNVDAATIAAAASAAGLAESSDLWSQNSRTFTDSNGLNTTVVGLTALNFKDANGTWQPIDDALTSDNATGYAWRNSADAYTVEFPANLATGPIRVSNNGGWIAFQVTGATGAGVVSHNAITYANALPGVTLTYAATPLGLKETITLANATATSSFAAVVTTSAGLTTSAQVDGGTGFVNAADDLIASFAKPWITDANQDMDGFYSAISASVSSTATNTWTYTLAVSATWLADLHRAWPITIDPTVNTSTFGSTDCLMFSGHPTTGFCPRTPAGVGYYGDDSLIRRDVMYWVVSAIPSSATVKSSTASIYEGLTQYAPISLGVYRNDQSFSSLNATWNDADAHTATAWVSGGGGDPIGSPLVTPFTFGCTPTDCPGWVDIPLTSATQHWVDGTWGSTGILLRSQAEGANGIVQFNDSHSTSNKPVLTLVWDRNPNTPTLTTPAAGATGQALSPTLSATITDPDGGGDLYAKFFLRSHGSGTWDIANGVLVPTPDANDSNGLNSGSTFSYTPSNPLAKNTSYDWAVQAWDVNLFSAVSATRTFTTAAAPAVPVVSSVRTCWPTNPAFTWTEATDPNTTITGYNYVLDQVASESNAPATSPTPQTTATSQDYGTSSPYAEGTWYFHVRAQNSALVWGDPNNPGYQVKIDRTAPSTPSNITSNQPTGTPTTTTTFSTNWTASTDAGCGVTGYYYAFDNSPIRSNSTTVTSDQQTTGMSAQVTNLADGNWYFHVRAGDAAGNVSSYATYGPVVVHSTLLSIVKTLTPSSAGVFGRGQFLHYTVTVQNVSTTPTTLTAVTDTVTAGQLLSGTNVTLSLNGQNTWHCLRPDANHSSAQCVISADGTTLSTPATYSNTLGPGDILTFTYTTLATGAENACTITQNTASAVDSAGTASVPAVPATICDTGLGIEPWWSYRGTSLGPQSAAQVNVANGNLVVQATDSTPMNARGRLGYVIRRSYNSQDTTALTLPGSIGAGWQLNVGATDDLAGVGITPTSLAVPTVDSVTAPLGITLVDRDGTRHVFTYRSASIAITSPVDVTSLTGGSPIHQLVAVDPLLLPSSLGGSAVFSHVCVDATYQAPPGVHLALWRYVGTNGSTCAAALNDANARVLGFATMRPDRLRSEFDATGHLLDLIDGSGVDLRYRYGTTGELRSISEPRTCTGTLGGSACRAILVTYSSDSSNACPIPSGRTSSECVTDPAGRRTIYAFDNATPKHLVEVDNPDDNPSDIRDRVQYVYQGYGASCGGSTSQLCTVIDPRVQPGSGSAITTTFAYTAQSLGRARVTGVTDRRGTTTILAYTGAPATSTTADVNGERTSYLSIDSSGRIGQIDLGATTGSPLSITRYTWDSASTSCTYVSGTVQGTHTAWARQDNNLCQLTRAKIGAASDETTAFVYTPEGQLLRSREVMSSGPDIYRTYAYASQYVRNGSASITATDSVSGNGDVAIGNRSTATGDGGTNAGDASVVYTLTDLVSTLTPRGNIAGATVANFRTDYVVADSAGAEPDVDNSASCAARNSGSVCSMAAPYSGTLKSTTTYTYDNFGQKLTATVPKSVYETAPSGQTNSYSYAYYGPGATDSATHQVDNEGWLQAVTDPAGRFAFFAYDAAGDVVRGWDRNATAGQTITSMNAAVAAGTPPSGYRQTLYAAGLAAMPWRYVRSSADALGNTTNYTVDADGNATTITSPRNNQMTQTFDEVGDLLTRTTPAEPGHPIASTYDAVGNVASITSPNGGITAYRYDALNRRVTTYTDRGSASSGTANPGGGCFATDTGANALQEYPLNEIVCASRMTYDEFGNVVSSIDGAGHTTTYTYDTGNRRVDTLTPRTDTVSYTTRTLYDADSNAIDSCPPRQFIDGGATTCSDSSPGVYSVHRTYSEANRLLTSTTYRARPTTVHGTPTNLPSTAAELTTYAYDADGNRTSVTDPDGHVTTDVYDFLDRKTSESTTRTSGITKRTLYTYDGNGNLLSTVTPGLSPVTTGGTDLTVNGGQFALPATSTSYHSITLTNGAWLTVPANSEPSAITINVASTVTICSTCGITLDGDGWAGGNPSSQALTTSGFTSASPGSGPGGAFGGHSAATDGGGGGGGGYAAVGSDGSNGGLVGGGGGLGGQAYGDPSIGGETTMQAGSGGGGGGTIGTSTLGGVGGAGGGFLHLSANAIVLDGNINARGADGTDAQTLQGIFGGGGGGGGSGGAVWLTAPQITTSNASLIGHIDVSGGAGGVGTPGGTDGAGGQGSQGRVRLDSDDLSPRIVSTAPAQRTRLGRVTAYSYDADNRLLDTVVGASTTVAGDNVPTSSDGGSNVRTRLGYDADGNVVAHYDPRAFASSVSSPDQRYESVAVYDANDRLTDAYQPYSDGANASDPNGAPSQCPDATTLGITDYQGLSAVHVCRLHYGYDHVGNRNLTRLPTYDSNNTTRVYTAAYTSDDLLASISVPNPSVTNTAGAIRTEAYTYDGAGRRLTAQQVPDNSGPTTTTTYTADGLVATVTPPTGGSSHLTTYAYDPNGARVSVTIRQDGSTNRTSYTDYNSDGSVYTNVDPAGNTTSYTYDAAGNRVSVFGPSANDSDPGNSTNPNHIPMTYTYFDDNLLATSSTPAVASGATRRLTTYGYDLGGDKTSVDVDYTDSSGTITADGSPQRFVYYPDGLLSSSTGRGGGSQAFQYDAAGHAVSSTDTANGNTTTTAATYYLNSSVRSVTESGAAIPTAVTTYGYDAAGALDLRQDQVGTTTTSTSFTYTDNEQPASVVGGVAGTTVTTGYDIQGRPTTTNFRTGVSLTRTWNADDTLASQSLGSNVGSSNWAYSYDGLFRVTAADNSSGTTSTDCTAATLPDGLQCFTYDAAGRLKTFTDSQASRTASYDADGNRLSYGDAAHAAAAPVVTAGYNPDDSIHDQKVGSGTDNVYAYAQPFGGVTSDGCSTYRYDGFDRLTSVIGTGSTGCTSNVSYAYDALDRQVQRTEGAGAARAGVTSLAYDGLTSTLTSESLPSSLGLTRYTLDAAGAPVAVTNSAGGGVAQYLADDGQGSVTSAVTSSNGNLACGFRYDPWGSAVSAGLGVTPACTSSNTPTDLQYRSESKDATTGTYQLGSRTYDPMKAGFLNPDSYRNAPSASNLSVGTDPLTRDTYNYVNGDPLNFTDPSGHRPCLDDVAGRAVCYGTTMTIGREVANIDRIETLQAIKTLISAAKNQIKHQQALGGYTRCVLEGGQNISFGQRIQLNELGLGDDPCAIGNSLGAQMWAQLTAEHFSIGDIPLIGSVIKDARSCFTSGSVSGCVNTALNAAMLIPGVDVVDAGARAAVAESEHALAREALDEAGEALTDAAAGATRGAPRFIGSASGDILDTSRVTIPKGKFGYLLDDPRKAGIFRDSLGFDADSLDQALRSHLFDNFGRASGIEPMTGGGFKFSVKGALTGPSGSSWNITSVWGIDLDGTIRLITATP